MFFVTSINGLIAFIKCDNIAIVALIDKVLVLLPVIDPMSKDKLPKTKLNNTRCMIVPSNFNPSRFSENIYEKIIKDINMNKLTENILVNITKIFCNAQT